MSQPHPYQSIDHDASISVQHGHPVEVDGSPSGLVTVEIVVGEHAETRITMWAEDFARMAATAMPDKGMGLLVKSTDALVAELVRRGVLLEEVVDARRLCSKALISQRRYTTAWEPIETDQEDQ